MVHGFVLVDSGAGTETALADAIRAVDAVERAHVVAGDSDIVVEVECEAVPDILRTVTREIRSLDGVGTTRTYVSLA